MSPEVPENLTIPVDRAVMESEWEFVLGPNDLVRVRVYGRPELATPASMNYDGTRVDPEGTLSLPLLAPLQVRGLTLSEARDKVTAAYSVYVKEPRVDFSVLEYSARRFYVYGDVAHPGPFAMDRPLNAYQALSFGGGFLPTADRERIVLLREVDGEAEVYVINGEELEASGLMAVQPEDFLFVMRSGSGKFRDEVLPILTGLGSTLASVGSLILIEDRIKD